MQEDSDRAQAPRRGSERPLVAGRYLLVRELGRGATGVVWLAADQFIYRNVAVKELRPPAGLSREELDVHQRSAARIHHPGAVTLYEAVPASEQDDAAYLIMEFVEGPTLAQLVTRDGVLPAARVAGFGRQLLDALEAAHALGIVHGDVKPGNILIGENDQVKLTDFGIARAIGEARLTSGGVLGTLAYQAPELFESGPVTPAVDLWSLGATLYYAVDGRGPFDRDSSAATRRAIVHDELPVPRCEPSLAAAITHMLRRDPAGRATIDQARAELTGAPAEGSPQAAGPDQPEPITELASTPAAGRLLRWPDEDTRPRPSAFPPPALAPEFPARRVPARRYRSRKAIVIAASAVAAVAAVAAGATFGLLARAGGPGPSQAIHTPNPTITSALATPHGTATTASATPPSVAAKIAAPSRLSEDEAGRIVAYVNTSKQIVYDDRASGWRGPNVLPGAARAGSPIVVSPDGRSVYFIEPSGEVVHDYVSGSGWQGPGGIGGVAGAHSGLAFYQGNGTGTRPAVVFVNSAGKLVYDFYTAAWHGPRVLPGTPRAGSPLLISADMQNIVFIKRNGDVVNDYLDGSRWLGPAPLGGVAEAASGLALAQDSGTGVSGAVLFVDASGKLVYDYYTAAWHGPRVLPGTPRSGSPVAWSGDGTSVYFIKADGKVATDFLSGSRWKGVFLTGGTAARKSPLAYAPGNGTAAGQPNLVFVARGGRPVYDWYASGWHGPVPLPRTAR